MLLLCLTQPPKVNIAFLYGELKDMFKAMGRQLVYFFEMLGNILYCSFLNLLLLASLILLSPTLLVVYTLTKIKKLVAKGEKSL